MLLFTHSNGTHCISTWIYFSWFWYVTSVTYPPLHPPANTTPSHHCVSISIFLALNSLFDWLAKILGNTSWPKRNYNVKLIQNISHSAGGVSLWDYFVFLKEDLPPNPMLSFEASGLSVQSLCGLAIWSSRDVL